MCAKVFERSGKALIFKVFNTNERIEKKKIFNLNVDFNYLKSN